MVVMAPVLATSRKPPPPELVVKVIVRFVEEVAGLPATSCICTVIKLEATPAVLVLGAVRMTSLVGLPGKMLNGTELVPIRAAALVATKV